MPPMLPNTSFKNELRMFFDNLDCVSHLKYVGDCIYANINNEIRLKAAFFAGINSGVYDRIRLTIINKARGEVDHVDVFMPMTTSPYGGISRKYLSLNSTDNRLSWYKKPETAEIKQIRTEIADFVSFYK